MKNNSASFNDKNNIVIDTYNILIVFVFHLGDVNSEVSAYLFREFWQVDFCWISAGGWYDPVSVE